MNNIKDMTTMERISGMYIKKDTLSTRIGLHDKYSVNKYGWFNWVFDQYAFSSGMEILELACGTAGIWQNRENRLLHDIKITLSDFSPIMVEKAKNLMSGDNRFSFAQIDIQNIPYENESFDMVIANHMLYHVPDIKKALSEVYRVLKKDGYFYCTTCGENTLSELQDIYVKLADKAVFSLTKNISFTLENGEGLLKNFFGAVEQRQYNDALEVTDIDDLIAYIKSYNEIPESVDNELYTLVKNGFSKDGIFRIKKEQGIFICKK